MTAQPGAEPAASEVAGPTLGASQGITAEQGSPEVLSLAQRLQRRLQRSAAAGAEAAGPSTAQSLSQAQGTAAGGGGGCVDAGVPAAPIATSSQAGCSAAPVSPSGSPSRSDDADGSSPWADKAQGRDQSDDAHSPLVFLRGLQQRHAEKAAGRKAGPKEGGTAEMPTPKSSKRRCPPVYSQPQQALLASSQQHIPAPPQAPLAAPSGIVQPQAAAAKQAVPQVDLTCSPSPLPLARRLLAARQPAPAAPAAAAQAQVADQAPAPRVFHALSQQPVSQSRGAARQDASGGMQSGSTKGRSGGCSLPGTSRGMGHEGGGCGQQAEPQVGHTSELLDPEQVYPTPKSTRRRGCMPVMCISDSEDELEGSAEAEAAATTAQEPAASSQQRPDSRQTLVQEQGQPQGQLQSHAHMGQLTGDQPQGSYCNQAVGLDQGNVEQGLQVDGAAHATVAAAGAVPAKNEGHGGH